MKLKIAVIGLAALCGVALGSGSAVAMPNGLPHADQIAGQTANVEQVRWICNAWGRCFWRRPAFYGAYAWGGPRPFWRPRPAFYGAYAWGPRPAWGWRRPAWYGAYAWGGPRPFWGWRRGWW
jgi:hypothetical protein